MVQRPSPESDTRPANVDSAGSRFSAVVVRSSSQDGISRQSNVLSYTSPLLGPVNVSVFYSPDTNAGGTPAVAATTGFTNSANVQTNARLYALTGYPFSSTEPNMSWSSRLGCDAAHS